MKLVRVPRVALIGLALMVLFLSKGHAVGQLAELGVDFRVSEQGIDGDPSFDATNPSVSYNGNTREYLVVWEGDINLGEDEIFGRRVDPTGNPVGSAIRISTQGPDGNTLFNARDPALSYNVATSEYLAVWEGDRIDNVFEIYGQRLSGSGTLIGNNFRISTQGTGSNTPFDAFDTVVAYNSAANEFLVVWEGDLTDNAFEIFGQRVGASGNLIGDNFQISYQGPAGDADYDAVDPAICYNATSNEFLVTWSGDITAGETEIFGQRIDAAGHLVGNNFRISTQGPEGNVLFVTEHPAISHNAVDNEYLVTWEGSQSDGEFEIFGQRVDGSGSLLAGNFRVSWQGVDGDTSVDALDPSATFNARSNEFLVAWSGDMAGNEDEIFVQRIGTDGSSLGASLRISTQGPVGDPQFEAVDSALHYNNDVDEYLVVWQGDYDSGAGVAGEEEIFAQRLQTSIRPGDFNADGLLDCADIDALVYEIAHQVGTSGFDLTGDGLVDRDDLWRWLELGGDANLGVGLAYLEGDANLDGVVDVSDFNLWNSNKFEAVAAWCNGDFSADGVVDVSDFNLWNSNKFRSSIGAASVPEPGSFLLLTIGLVIWVAGLGRMRCPR